MFYQNQFTLEILKVNEITNERDRISYELVSSIFSSTQFSLNFHIVTAALCIVLIDVSPSCVENQRPAAGFFYFVWECFLAPRLRGM